MSPYEKIMSVLRSGGKDGSRIQAREERVPCINSAGTYTLDLMKDVDAFWPAAHLDAEKMSRLGSAAHRITGLDNATVPFDMVVEAEVLGAEADLREQAAEMPWPTVRRYVVKEPADVMVPRDILSSGRISVVVKAISKLKNEFQEKVPINVMMVPPFTSVGSYLVDPVSFYQWLRTEPEKVKSILDTAFPAYEELARLYEESGADILTFHEMGASAESISPMMFQEFAMPYIRKLVGSVKIPTILNICGRVDLIASQMVECGASAVAFDERTSVRQMRTIVDGIKAGYPLIGNLSPVNVLSKGPKELIEDKVREVVNEGISIVSPGCDFWVRTPTENIRYMVEATSALV